MLKCPVFGGSGVEVINKNAELLTKSRVLAIFT